MITATLLLSAPDTQAELRYTCDELGNMAKQFHDLKSRRYTLEDVLAVVQKGSANNPAKEKLLSELAIEVYIDPDVVTGEQAYNLGHRRCNTARK